MFWIIPGVIAAVAVKVLSDSSSSSSTRVVSETSTPSAEEIEKERVAKIKKEIKEYKSKITQILKAEYQVEVEIKKDSIKVIDNFFVNEKLNYLFENFHLGMNVFRTAKGGRDPIKE